MSNWSGWEDYQPTKKKKASNKSTKYPFVACGIKVRSSKVTDQLPKVSEKELTKMIREYLNLKGIFHWKVWQGLGSQKGIPDILGILPDGRLLAIEVKTYRGKVSPSQQAFIDNINERGGVAFVARCVEDVSMQIQLHEPMFSVDENNILTK